MRLYLLLFCLGLSTADISTSSPTENACLPPSMEMSELSLLLSSTNNIVTCPILSFPAEGYKWIRDGVPIDFSQEVPYKRKGRDLVFNAAFIQPGTYRCSIDNRCGREMSLPIKVESLKQQTDVDVGDHSYAVLSSAGMEGECTWVRAPRDGGLATVVSSQYTTDRLVVVENDLYIKYFFKNDSICNFICIAGTKDKTFRLAPINYRGNFDLVPIFPRGQHIKVELNRTEDLVPCLFYGKGYDHIVYYEGDEIVGNDTLLINSVKMSEKRSFSCIPALDGTLLTAHKLNFTVSIYQLLQLSDSLRSLNLTSGENAIFKCVTVSGFPKPQIQWSINSEYLNKTNHKFASISTGDNTTLNISQATQSMSIQCLVYNDFGKSAKTVYLKIIEKPKLYFNFTDKIEITPFNRPNLECRGKVDPIRETYITWLYNGVQIDHKTNQSLYFILKKDNTSTFLFSLPSDKFKKFDGKVGALTCIVSDGFSALNKTVMITLHYVGVAKGVSLVNILWIPFASLIVLVIFISGMCFYRRRNHKSYTVPGLPGECVPFRNGRKPEAVLVGNPDYLSSHVSLNSDAQIEEDAHSLLNNRY